MSLETAGASNVLNQRVTLLLAELDRAVHAAAKAAAETTITPPGASTRVDESATGVEIDRA